MLSLTRLKRFLVKYRRALIISVHLFLILGAYGFSFLLRFDFRLTPAQIAHILKTIPLVLLIKLLIFYYYGLFYGLWRYVSMDDLWQILKANSLATTIFILCEHFLLNLTGFPRSIFIVDFILCTALVAGVRFFTRLLKERYKNIITQRQKRVLVVGAGEAGILMLKEFSNNPSMGQIIGFIDDDPVKQNSTIYGRKILGRREDIAEVAGKYQPEEIIIAIPSAKGETIREILSYCQIPGVKLKIVPGLQKIIDGEIELRPREVKPEDLLGRETVVVNEGEISTYIKGKTVLVTGSGGTIGSALSRHIARFNPARLILLDHNENNVYFLEVELRAKYPRLNSKTFIGDIKDVGLLKHLFSNYAPQVIFHTAAHKHVSLMEENPVAAIKNNVIGTRNLIYAAGHYKTERFVMISTDKAVNPAGIMGATKRISEMVLQAKAKKSKTKFMAVRFGNVLGSDGSVVPLFKKQIEDGGPVTVTHPDVKRYFMSVNEAAQLVLQAGAMGNGGEVFILDMGEQIRIVDLARDLITLSGFKPELDIPIKFIGLRKGEKLSEEMFFENEKGLATKHDKIHIVQPNDFDPRKLRFQVKELDRLAKALKEEEVVKKIRELVPSCDPNGRDHPDTRKNG